MTCPLMTGRRNSISKWLDRGEVLVTTITGLPVQTKSLTITPTANGSAKYEVLDTAESTRVLTHEGSVLVKGGNPVPQPN
jgi:hypothetical protein